MATNRLAAGTGNWNTFSSVIISSEPGARCEEVDGATVVHTPLDLIMLLEADPGVSEVVLAGSYANSTSLLSFLRELYPRLPIAFEPGVRRCSTSISETADACLWLG